jgi:DNA-nicking Smr family endonuclease
MSRGCGGASVSGDRRDELDDDDDETFEPPDEVVLPIEDWIDLHTFLPADVRSVVLDYLEAAVAAGMTEVRIVHGRGAGVQRQIVRGVLSQDPRVVGFEDAPPERGGRGATLVRLDPGRASG